MNVRIASFVAVTVTCIMILTGCSDRNTYTVWKPIYKSWADVRSGFATSSPQELKKPGKIYIKGSYLFINEINQGIHVIDNSNPWQPKNISFIAIPGNVDIAVKDNILYADGYIDLLAIDISNPNDAKLVKRINAILPYQGYDAEHNVYLDSSQGVPVDWKQETVEYDNNAISPVDMRFLSSGAPTTSGSSGEGGSTGTGGSMARFTIYSDYLYTVSNTDLQIFTIKNPSSPVIWSRVPIGWNIETIFPYKDKLFIGSQTSMYIYDLKNPLFPSQLCQFRHARSCDPVVCDDNYAYVTTRSGSRCGGGQNQLSIVDIRDITNPVLVKAYAMQEPYGLGVDGKTVFICDGIAGLKTFDAGKPDDLQFLAQLSDFRTYDIIPMGGHAIIVGPDGLYQYDYSDPANLKLMSKIPVIK